MHHNKKEQVLKKCTTCRKISDRKLVTLNEFLEGESLCLKGDNAVKSTVLYQYQLELQYIHPWQIRYYLRRIVLSVQLRIAVILTEQIKSERDIFENNHQHAERVKKTTE